APASTSSPPSLAPGSARSHDRRADATDDGNVDRSREGPGVSAVAAPASPFKGLAPFGDSDVDALFFFGRTREIEVIAANLQASRLTVLFGPSGVGKSSVLRAGVAHRLRAEVDVVVAVVDSWAGDAVGAV